MCKVNCLVQQLSCSNCISVAIAASLSINAESYCTVCCMIQTWWTKDFRFSQHGTKFDLSIQILLHGPWQLRYIAKSMSTLILAAVLLNSLYTNNKTLVYCNFTSFHAEKHLVQREVCWLSHPPHLMHMILVINEPCRPAHQTA
jgi:hypothetical protein